MITISPEDRALLEPELHALIAPLAEDAPLRRDHDRLRNALTRGEVPADLVPVLEDALELLLSSGRIRRGFGPFEELQLFRLYQRTPTGRAIKEQLDRVNAALEGLRGQTVHDVSFSLKLPGVYRLEIATDRGDLVLTIDRHAVSVNQLEVSA